ncbi:hypothetical protein D3C71_1536200 [compost metagenome]
MHVANGLSIAEKVEHQRRGDVVRQVTKYAQRLASLLGHFGEVHRHGILLVNGQLVFQLRVVCQTGRQIAVQLNHRHAVHARADRLGQCAQAGTDFNDRFARHWVNGGNNAIDDKLIG